MNKPMNKKWLWPHRNSVTLLCALLMAGCGGGGNSGPSSFTVGGSISGLGAATGLKLSNGSDTLTVAANATSFTMPTAVANGHAYDVTVTVHPTAMSCSVMNGAGTVNGANVTNVSVSCQAGAESVFYSFVGGTTDGVGPYGHLVQASDGNFYGMTANGGTSNDGIVFKITPGGVESLLYSFAGGATDGAYPLGSLVQGSDGNFYGMTNAGGASNDGVIFKITPSGTESVLHSFAGAPNDGATPYGRLIQGSDGNFYGMTNHGGTKNLGVIFMITPGGTETVLHSFAGGTADGATPEGSLLQASDGNFYGLANSGGASGNGVVFKLTPSGTESIIYSFAGGKSDGSQPEGTLIEASDGDLYSTTVLGGASDSGTVFKITLSGTETLLYSFAGGTTDGVQPFDGVIQASDGNFYGMTSAGGTSNKGILFELTPGGTETVLHSFAGVPSDGATPVHGLIQASDGTLYGSTIKGGAHGQGALIEFN